MNTGLKESRLKQAHQRKTLVASVFPSLKSLTSFFIFAVILSVVTGCLQNPSSGNGRRSTSSQGATSDDTTNTPDDPTFETSANYIQNGSSQSTTTTILSGDFATSLYLRGEQIDKFVKDGLENTVQCIVVPFTNASVQRGLVMAAFPRFFNNFSAGTREYFYEFRPADTSSNSTFCQQPGVLNSLISNFPGTSPVYQLADVCPNCSLSTLLSDALTLMTDTGLTVTEVTTINLRIELRPRSNSSVPSNLTCNSSSECASKGFDCCSFGQCVNDKQVRSDIDQTSLGFQQAILDIQENPGAITNYPEYFHLCGTNIPVDPNPTPSPDPAVEAGERFLKRKALYDCTTPIEGEMAICQKTYSDVQETIASTMTNQFFTGEDDRNFNSSYSGTSTLLPHSIFKVVYAGETLFENEAIVQGMTIGPGGNGSGNDNLDDPQVINLTHTPSSSAPNDDLTIQYKIDGSCEKISTFVAKCYKVYVQGQNEGKITDHFPASNNFLLPYYADANKTITVTVDEAQSFQFSDWNLVQTTPARVEFTGDLLSVFDTQVVKINFFINLQNYPNVLQQKQAAVDEIKSICGCGNLECRLTEVKDASDNVVDYKCYYPPPPLPPPPLQQTVLISAKTAPHRYFDLDGVYQEDPFESETRQEGNEFKYINNDLLRPNNVDDYVGFNEIYGSFTKKAGTAVPATEVRVQAGKTYDIYTDSGSYSTCFFCGTDYYSSLARIFPQSFLSNGGGYSPDLEENNPLETRVYRKDDLLFGRACFVPATMIPWTHAPESTRQDQRRKRLAAQHFLFANGYQRDWYGFDYGSIIGSFDGVRWFSIGNQRRIQARSNKLFLAVNSYFSDLTDNTTFSITVQDTSTVSGIGSFVTNDFESDGAECQKNHVCETDADCAAQLGWEYSCESITSIRTPWPRFDSNGLEIPGVSDTVNLRSLFGQTAGSSKRCVYRGRGAMCIQDYNNSTDSSSNFTGTTQTGLHACSANTHCQRFIEGVAVAKFNDRIARYGKSVKSQNASSFVTEDDLDVFGMGARISGRPYSWTGNAIIPVDAQTNLGQNSVTAMCLPGRDNDLSDDSFLSNHSTPPTSEALGDQITGIGVTPSFTAGTSGTRSDYLSRCSILDEGGNYFHEQSTYATTLLSSDTVTELAGRQAVSTNLLDVFENDNLPVNEIIKSYETEFIDEFVYQEDRCLRAPGATCFSALDCAPNAFISGQIASISNDDSTVDDILNRYEVNFWKEELICSQDKTPDDEDFSLSDNRCCRETEKNLTIGTATLTSADENSRDIDFKDLPGLTTPINSPKRNTRLSTVWDLINGGSGNYPFLKVFAANSCAGTCGDTSDLEKQFNTFSEIATRTCCSKNWVRLFDREDNGGGHTWGPNKLQTIPKETFRCYNYSVCNPLTGQCGEDSGDSFFGFTCSHTDEPDEPNCRARQITEFEAEGIFNWMGTFELTGIPQVSIKSQDYSDIRCAADPLDQSQATTAIPPGLIAPGAIREYDDENNDQRYSAADMTNFDSNNIKQIFSNDEVVCCLPSGTQVGQNADPDQCCTGYVGSSGRCQLPAYTDVSLYFNRYVSSEAQEEDVSAFDNETGYLNSPFDVVRLACKKRVCESNSLVEGVALSNLRTRGHEGSDKQKFRFIDGSDPANNANGLADLFDRGLKWNTHYYCNDPELENPLPGTIDCGEL